MLADVLEMGDRQGKALGNAREEGDLTPESGRRVFMLSKTKYEPSADPDGEAIHALAKPGDGLVREFRSDAGYFAPDCLEVMPVVLAVHRDQLIMISFILTVLAPDVHGRGLSRLTSPGQIQPTVTEP